MKKLILPFCLSLILIAALCVPTWAGVDSTETTVSVDGTGNDWSDAIQLEKGEIYDISVSGTWGGAVKIQRSFDAGTTWHDYASYTANIEDYDWAGSRGYYRIGAAAGAVTSGTAVCRLSR
jgi:hypothetical protein